MTGYDIIGDVHGCAFELMELLGRLGYERDGDGPYRHPERTAVFIGDLVDRGEDQLRVLEIVKGMHDGGSAQVLMGNHEFNAICFATPDPDAPGEFSAHAPERTSRAIANSLSSSPKSSSSTIWIGSALCRCGSNSTDLMGSSSG